MTHSILSTLSIAAFGLFAARAGDLLRVPFFRRKPCDDATSKGAAWSYEADAVQSQNTWKPVRLYGSC
jgi:hypothetical protein